MGEAQGACVIVRHWEATETGVLFIVIAVNESKKVSERNQSISGRALSFD